MPNSPPPLPPLEVYLLGLTELDDLLRLQRRLVYDAGEAASAALVLCEHPPIITVGRSGSRAHLVPDDQALRRAGIPVRWVGRGGGCVLHLPGQLAGYLVVPLERLGLDLAGHLARLEQVLRQVLGQFDLDGQTRPDAPGIFLGHARVASVGIAVNRWIAYHGFTLNVGPYLGAFELLDEPGPGGQRLRQTSMESRRGRMAPMSRVRELLIERTARAYGLDHQHVYTDHPLVRRKVFTHVYAPSVG
jgi:lipoyl(octanoyl) transferase